MKHLTEWEKYAIQYPNDPIVLYDAGKITRKKAIKMIFNRDNKLTK